MRLCLECRIPDINGTLERRPTNEAARPRKHVLRTRSRSIASRGYTVTGKSQCVSPAQAGPQPRRISQEGTEGERIPPPRFLHDPVVLGQCLHDRAVAFRRDVISPGTAAPADDDPVTPAVGVACDACHGPRAKMKSRCHFSRISRLNKLPRR